MTSDPVKGRRQWPTQVRPLRAEATRPTMAVEGRGGGAGEKRRRVSAPDTTRARQTARHRRASRQVRPPPLRYHRVQPTAATSDADVTLHNHDVRPHTPGHTYAQVVRDGPLQMRKCIYSSTKHHATPAAMAAPISSAVGEDAGSSPAVDGSACTAAATARRTSEKWFHATALPNRRRPPRTTRK